MYLLLIFSVPNFKTIFRLLAELCLHGVFGKEGIQLLGSTLSYLTLTDRVEHLNVPVLLPFCKTLNVDLLGLHSYSMKQVGYVLIYDLLTSLI